MLIVHTELTIPAHID